jgi:hypothetical protein
VEVAVGRFAFAGVEEAGVAGIEADVGAGAESAVGRAAVSEALGADGAGIVDQDLAGEEVGAIECDRAELGAVVILEAGAEQRWRDGERLAGRGALSA